MLLRDIISAVVTVAAYFTYYGFADLRDRRWMYYVMGGVLATWVGWCWRQDGLSAGRPLLAFSGSVMLIEGPQQAVCGLLRWRSTQPQDMCVQVLGESLYVALASLLLAGVFTWGGALWPSRPPVR